MKREYSKEGDVLTFKFHVPGWPQVAIDEFVNEVVAQAEPSDYHPAATIIEQEVEQLDVDAERRAFAEEEAEHECPTCGASHVDGVDCYGVDLDADGYDASEPSYDPDEDRTP